MNAKIVTLALGGLLVALLASSSMASASFSACTLPNENQCVCVTDVFEHCSDTASGNQECLIAYSYDQGYWWGYLCIVPG